VSGTHYNQRMKPENTVNELLDNIRAITDRAERFEAATKALEVARTDFMTGARRIRQETVQELRDEGMTLADISKLLGVDRSRLHQISTGVTGGKRKPKEERS
jgi:hypothetical protein